MVAGVGREQMAGVNGESTAGLKLIAAGKGRERKMGSLRGARRVAGRAKAIDTPVQPRVRAYYCVLINRMREFIDVPRRF